MLGVPFVLVEVVLIVVIAVRIATVEVGDVVGAVLGVLVLTFSSALALRCTRKASNG